ncbi:hypothetical protein [Parasediminibacterium sp. JCM 36343]|uniref:hypothetical protein n=1 Tax=Parasediminibacterium sp. JCM 36343 TaxID=3374279 RepID=UPI0039781BC0
MASLYMLEPYFCTVIEKYMSNHLIEKEENKKDFTKNWVNSSKFLFYLTVFCFISFVFGSCYKLYQSRYKGHPDVEVQSSSKYVPEYK